MTAPDPYKGLRPFDDSEQDALFFFGRERDREVIAANLLASRFTVLYGPSGVGKSSVLRAGVARQVRGLPESPVVVIFSAWSADPAAGLAAAVGAEAGIGAGGLLETLGAAASLRGELYLILDQAEELFLYDEGGFVQQLSDVVNAPDLHVNVLLSVRDDALARLDVFKAQIPHVLANTLRLDRLDRAAGRAAIVRPVERWSELADGAGPIDLEPDLVEAVLDEVGAGRIDVGIGGRGAAEDVVGEGIETPFLQLVMQRVWNVERAGGSDRLRLATLQDLGGAQEIVAEHLSSAIAKLSSPQRDVAARLFNYLVTPSGSKVAHDAPDLAEYAGVPPAEVGPVLAQLSEGRILRPVAREGGGEPRYEIFHDVLAGAVLSWRSRHESDRRVELERRAARRRHRLTLRLAAAAVVALAAMLAVTVFALAQRSSARAAARSAQSRELAASALSQLSVDPQDSVRLALAAAELEQSERSEDVLRGALRALRLLRTVQPGEPVTRLAFGRSVLAAGTGRLGSYDANLKELTDEPLGGRLLELRGDVALVLSGRTILIRDLVTGRVDRVTIPLGELPVRDVETGSLTGSIPAPKTIRFAALGPRRTLLAVSDGSRRAVVVNALTGEGRFLLEQPSAVTALRFGPAARTLAVGGADGSVLLWSVDSGTHRGTLRFGHAGHIVDIAFSPRATLLATASTDGTARVWRVGIAQPLSVLPGHESYVNDVEFSRDGSFVVTAGKDGTARVWRAENGAALATLRGHRDSVLAAAFYPSGGRVVTAGADGSLRLWDAVRQPPLKLLRGYDEPVERVRFVGDLVEAVTADGSLHVIEPDGTEAAERAAEPAPPERASDGATVERDGTIAVVTRPGGKTVDLSGHRGVVMSARFSPDGTLVVTASRDHDVIIWDARTGKLVRKLVGHFGIVSDARFSPDGRWIVTAGPGKPGIWDAQTGELLYFLQGHEDRLLSAAFDATSRRIVTGGADGTVRTYLCTICGEVGELIPAARARLAAIGR